MSSLDEFHELLVCVTMSHSETRRVPEVLLIRRVPLLRGGEVGGAPRSLRSSDRPAPCEPRAELSFLLRLNSKSCPRVQTFI